MKQHTITFEPSEQDAQFIAGQLQEGSYKTQSELIRAGIRRLEEDDTKLKALRRLIEEGEQSGELCHVCLGRVLGRHEKKISCRVGRFSYGHEPYTTWKASTNIASNFLGIARAETYLSEINKAFEALANHDKLGRDYSRVSADLYAYNIAAHVIFYTPTPTGILVIGSPS